MMLLSRWIKCRRVLIPPILTNRFIILVCSPFSSHQSFVPSKSISHCASINGITSKDVAMAFRDWFQCRNDALLDRIFEILASKDEDDDHHIASRAAAELQLSQLGLKLNEEFVLNVLNHGKDVLSCLKFFDWAGRQHGYNHTRATFSAIFKILSREKLMSLMLDFLQTYAIQRHMHNVRFYDTLVMGYAVAGKPEIALQLFGKMRFQGLDLDSFAYNVLLNALVEEGCFDIVDVIFKQVSLRGLEDEITINIRVKNLCKQNKLDEAEAYLRGLERNGSVVNDRTLSVFVDALCKKNRFEEAGRLVEDFRESGKVRMDHTYGIWIRDLVEAGKIDGAIKFLRGKQFLEGYVPDVFRYNILICRLLKENRLDDVFDLLMEMKNSKISPDRVTMNAALCFFCKAGMVDIALQLYDSKSEFGLSPSSMAYNFLINTLCGDGSVDDAYRVLRDSVDQGYFPGNKTFSILADALCREGKLDKMKELVVIAQENNVVPTDDVCVKYIMALCKARRVEEGYLMLGELNRTHRITSKSMYSTLIRGFNRLSRGDMSSRLLIEMQNNGHTPTRKLYRSVIQCLCSMDNPENQVFKLLEMQLSLHEPDCQVYSFFIDGAGHARKPELARSVYEMISKSGIEPNTSSKVLMLQSYVKSERIVDAKVFYDDLSKEKRPSRKLYNALIVGLSKVNKPGTALEILREVREKGLIPSLECYEELVRAFCSIKNYEMVVQVLDDLTETGRPISSFIGNFLLLHSLTSKELYLAWVQSRPMVRETSLSDSLTLRELVGLFSGGLKVGQYLRNLDEVIERVFPLDVFTYNMLLRRLSMVRQMDDVLEFFYEMCKKGYQPNKWSYDIIVHGLCKCGRKNEAKRWLNAMVRQGFEPTEVTRKLL
ncbi:hypothetical protein Scep_017211 [Stephania cephalantha]|uniref:Pentatricopeptide repeat-containing protein n=1 Tax=Stephania cephalantha TaxID=152367 RepID=A0AAP0IQH0_9MAGN